MAADLVRTSSDLVAGWLDYLDALPSDQQPRNPAGLLVSKVRAAEEPPAPVPRVGTLDHYIMSRKGDISELSMKGE